MMAFTSVVEKASRPQPTQALVKTADDLMAADWAGSSSLTVALLHASHTEIQRMKKHQQMMIAFGLASSHRAHQSSHPSVHPSIPPFSHPSIYLLNPLHSELGVMEVCWSFSWLSKTRWTSRQGQIETLTYTANM